MEKDGIAMGEWSFGAIGAPRVLLAEDEAIVRLDLRQILEQNGFEVCGEARDGAEAVELARELEPDAAILDLKMPGLDGVEAARRIYAARPLPIVMLTAYSDRRSVERAIGAGIFTYLVKPFRETDVVPALRAALARHAELLSARRLVGSARDTSVEVLVPSRGGGAWPLRLTRSLDGRTEVGLAPPASGE